VKEAETAPESANTKTAGSSDRWSKTRKSQIAKEFPQWPLSLSRCESLALDLLT
jgi:hypothetical protein